MKNFKTRIIIYAVLLVILLAAFKLYTFYSLNNGEIFYGNIDRQTQALSFEFPGRIKNLLKDEGDFVKKGEALAVLDDEYLQNALVQLDAQIAQNKAILEKLENGYRYEDIDQAKAEAAKSEANLNEAKKTFERQKQLLNTNSTSKQNFDTAKAKFELAVAAASAAKSNLSKLENGYEKLDIKAQKSLVELLEAKREKINIDLKNSVIVAPNNGTVLTKFKENGENAGAHEPVYEIAKVDDFWVRAYVDEKNLGLFEVGDKMEIYTDFREKPYAGHISFIATVCEFTPKNVQTIDLRTNLVYRFKVNFDEIDDKIKQGVPVHVKKVK